MIGVVKFVNNPQHMLKKISFAQITEDSSVARVVVNNHVRRNTKSPSNKIHNASRRFAMSQRLKSQISAMRDTKKQLRAR